MDMYQVWNNSENGDVLLGKSYDRGRALKQARATSGFTMVVISDAADCDVPHGKPIIAEFVDGRKTYEAI